MNHTPFGLGFRTLLSKEVRRFMRVPGQTVFSPLITTTLYFLVFGFTSGSRGHDVHGVPYARFIVPGLVMLGIITNSFANSSSSLFMLKMQGTIVDLLVAPMSYVELLGAFVLASVVRGLVVGGAMWIVASLFTTFEVVHPIWALTFILLVAAFCGVLGVLVAIWAEKFEQINLVPTFFITPLTFLGGVFYSVESLPGLFRHAAFADPVLYMVEGLRYAILGASDVGPWAGLGLLLTGNVAAHLLAWKWLKSGYRLRG
ncbi:MAG: hypothetical protein RL199_1691 [Pseudomonadota bacterium]|jgi:ABC-2 type transport system permease protein